MSDQTPSLFAELRRRNVIRVGVAWLALSWLLAAMCSLLFPALGLPITALRWIIIGLLLAWIPVLLLAWRYELTAQGVRVDRGPGSDNPHNLVAAKRIDQMTVVVVLAALSLSLLRQFITEHAPAPAAPPAATIVQIPVQPPRPPGPVDPHSLAVLPFSNMSPDPANAYFADGLSEDLLNVLARIEGLKVISRTSSFAFRDRSLPTREIAAQLGVAHTLEGSVRRQGDEVRISVQLIDAATENQLWSQTYDRRLVDIFRVQQEISQAIADALVESLGVRRVEVSSTTSDLVAYELFLRGRQLFAQRGANLPAARELLEQSVQRDPQFADAWAILAGTWYVWRSYAEEPEGVSTVQRTEAAAAKALAINPSHPGALAVSARIAAGAGDHLRDALLIDQALALEPNNANTWLWKGLGQFEVGHIARAHVSFSQAQRLDPLSGLQTGWLGITTGMLGDPVLGKSMLQRAHALGWRGPASRGLFFLADSNANENADISTRKAQASQVFLNWLHDDDGMPQSQRDLVRALVPALSDPRQLADAQRQLLEAATRAPEQDWATLLQQFGLTEAAIDHALNAPQAGLQRLLFGLWYPRFRDVLHHPRFPELARKQGLFAYWLQHGPPDGCALITQPTMHLECAP